MFRIAVTGHRPKKLGWGYNFSDQRWIDLAWRMREILLARLKKFQSIECITGMALGVDQLFGLVALKLKKQNYPVKIFCAIPCRGQEKIWPDASIWLKIKENADEVQFICDGEYNNKCMQKRNIFMVDRCDELIAVFDGKPSGGTYNCVNYAVKKGKPIINLFPESE